MGQPTYVLEGRLRESPRYRNARAWERATLLATFWAWYDRVCVSYRADGTAY